MKITVDDLLRLKYRVVGNLDILKKKNIKGVSTDSRTIKTGEIFFAIKGVNFDGHKFVDEAFRKGAVCAVISEQVRVLKDKKKPFILVSDTVKALGELASIYRSKFDIPIIAVAGSNGKTTTKEMIYSILRKKYTVLKTYGNLNNYIGVPLTLFRLNKRYEVAIIEIGMNHIGEVGYLCNIVKPTHGIVTNVGREHLQFFPSVDRIAKEESELFKRLNHTGIGFVNADDRYLVKYVVSLKNKVTYGFQNRKVDVVGKLLKVNSEGCAKLSIKQDANKSFNVQLKVPGVHTAANALAASAVGLNFSILPQDIREALEQFKSVEKRMEVKRRKGVTIIDDTYNANPDSMISAIDVLQRMKCKGKKIVVLSDMLELGSFSKKEHSQVGKKIDNWCCDFLFTYGDMDKCIYDKSTVKNKFHYKDKAELAKSVLNVVSKDDIVLVKGSRGMKMENVVNYLWENIN